jgi:acyl-CoA thioesterase
MSYADFLASIQPTETGLTAEVPESWKQGRTTYGGISAALCLMAAEKALSEPRALRSALISFVGPSGGSVEVTAERLRSGRTASAVRARLTSEAGIGAETVFTFAAGRESALSLAGPAMPETSRSRRKALKAALFRRTRRNSPPISSFIWRAERCLSPARAAMVRCASGPALVNPAPGAGSTPSYASPTPCRPRSPRI